MATTIIGTVYGKEVDRELRGDETTILPLGNNGRGVMVLVEATNTPDGVQVTWRRNARVTIIVGDVEIRRIGRGHSLLLNPGTRLRVANPRYPNSVEGFYSGSPERG